jgi:hypothetical protein
VTLSERHGGRGEHHSAVEDGAVGDELALAILTRALVIAHELHELTVRLLVRRVVERGGQRVADLNQSLAGNRNPFEDPQQYI